MSRRIHTSSRLVMSCGVLSSCWAASCVRSSLRLRVPWSKCSHSGSRSAQCSARARKTRLGSIIGMAGWLAVKSRDCTASKPMRFTLGTDCCLSFQSSARSTAGDLARRAVESAHFQLSTSGRPLLIESRRRAYLNAMQVVNWLPRTELPFAAPSRPELLDMPKPEPEVPAAPAPQAQAPVQTAVARPSERPKIEVPRPSLASTRNGAKPVEEADTTPVVAKPAPVPPPRFALQLLRAGRCLLLVELPTGEAFQSRDPAYLLLKDMLRAAGLPDAPQIVGEPVRWPWLNRGTLDQGPEAARDFVQGFLSVQMEAAPCACLWLIGLP